MAVKVSSLAPVYQDHTGHDCVMAHLVGIGFQRTCRRIKTYIFCGISAYMQEMSSCNLAPQPLSLGKSARAAVTPRNTARQPDYMP